MCGCLHRVRGCFWKIVPVLWIVDLGLTVYLTFELIRDDSVALLISKCVVLLLLLLLETRSCLKKMDSDIEEAKQSQRCCSCNEWGIACCSTTFILLLKVIFLIFAMG